MNVWRWGISGSRKGILSLDWVTCDAFAGKGMDGVQVEQERMNG